MATLYGPDPNPEPLAAVSDLAGTPVVDIDGSELGTVYGALAEVDSGLIRYFDCALDYAPRHVLVPVGHARVDREDGGARLRLRALNRDEIDAIPTYDGDGEVDDQYEDAVLSALGRLYYGERYYAHPAYDHSGLYAGSHPIVSPDGAGEVQATPGAPDLVPLGDLTGYRVADGVPDIRGWTVRAGDGAAVGRVLDLVVDVATENVRYVLAGAARERAAVLPVGYARIERAPDRVELPVLRGEDVDRLRLHEPGEPIDRGIEERVRDIIEQILSGERRFQRADFKPADDES